jgi:hypothetical protein
MCEAHGFETYAGFDTQHHMKKEKTKEWQKS